jgi:hypothetical protein
MSRRARAAAISTDDGGPRSQQNAMAGQRSLTQSLLATHSRQCQSRRSSSVAQACSDGIGWIHGRGVVCPYRVARPTNAAGRRNETIIPRVNAELSLLSPPDVQQSRPCDDAEKACILGPLPTWLACKWCDRGGRVTIRPIAS